MCRPGLWLHQSGAAIQADGLGSALPLHSLHDQLAYVIEALTRARQSPLPTGLCILGACCPAAWPPACLHSDHQKQTAWWPACCRPHISPPQLPFSFVRLSAVVGVPSECCLQVCCVPRILQLDRRPHSCLQGGLKAGLHRSAVRSAVTMHPCPHVS